MFPHTLNCDWKIKMQTNMTYGCHDLYGNMVALEYNTDKKRGTFKCVSIMYR